MNVRTDDLTALLQQPYPRLEERGGRTVLLRSADVLMPLPSRKNDLIFFIFLRELSEEAWKDLVTAYLKKERLLEACDLQRLRRLVSTPI